MQIQLGVIKGLSIFFSKNSHSVSKLRRRIFGVSADASENNKYWVQKCSRKRMEWKALKASDKIVTNCGALSLLYFVTPNKGFNLQSYLKGWASIQGLPTKWTKAKI